MSPPICVTGWQGRFTGKLLALSLAASILSGCREPSPVPSPSPTSTPISLAPSASSSPTPPPPRVARRPAQAEVVRAVLDGSAYVSPQAANYILGPEALDLLTRGDYPQLEQLLDAANRGKARWGAGQNGDFVFSNYLSIDAVTPLGGRWEKDRRTYQVLLHQLQEWSKSQPKSVRARMALAYAAYLQANWILGDGRLSDYSQRRQDSNAFWGWAVSLAKPKPGEAPSDLGLTLPLAMGLRARTAPTAAQAALEFDQALRANPGSPAAYTRLIDHDLRWSREQLANQVTSQLKQSEARFARLHAYVLCIPYPPDVLGPFKQWLPLKRGYQQLLKAEPGSIFLHNAYAKAARLNDDKAVLREQLRALGTQWDRAIWKSYPDYRAACEAVGVSPTSPEAQTVPKVLSLGGEAVRYPQKLDRGQPFQIQVRDLLKRQQFAELEEIARRLRGKDDDRLNSFYQAFTDDLSLRRDYEAHLGDLRRWSESYPESSTAVVALENFYVPFAWLARGSGWGYQITEKGSELFEHRLSQAETAYKQAEQANNRDEARFAERITLLMATTGDRDEAIEQARQALKAHPRQTEVLNPLCNFLLPRWHGQPGDIGRVAELLSKDSKLGNGVYTLMALATCKYEPKALTDPQSPCSISWNRVVSGFARLRRLNLARPALLEEMLMASLAVKDDKQARLAIKLLGERWTPHLFQDRRCFQGVKAWAEGKGSSPYSRPTITVRRLSWEEHGKIHPGSIVPARKGVRLRVELDSKPSPGELYSVTEVMSHPPMSAPDNVILTEHSSDLVLFPREQVGTYVYSLDQDYELVPGKWEFSISDGESDQLVKASFTLQKP